MSTTVLPPSVADLGGVLSETKRIIQSHSGHFLGLSVLFLLPLSVSLSVFPTLLHLFTSSHHQTHNYFFPRLHYYFFPHFHLPLQTLASILIFSASSLLFLLSASASLTYSSFHAFYGRPLKLAASLSSLSHTFLPLLATFATALLYISLPLSAFALYEFLAWNGISLITSSSATHSPYFLAISFLGALVLGSLFANLAVNWILLAPVVVLENRWGFDALSRSKDLVRSMRTTAMSLLMFIGLQAVILIWIITPSSLNRLKNWYLAMHILLTSAILMLFLLQGISAGAVFYIYCKAVKGELEDEISNEYADLPPVLISLLQQ